MVQFKWLTTTTPPGLPVTSPRKTVIHQYFVILTAAGAEHSKTMKQKTLKSGGKHEN
jgi:hypothetical protein